MRRDSIFYQLFQQSPTLLFELLTTPPINATDYRFDSVAAKEPKFEIDGVFLPPNTGSPGVVYFCKVQFQKDELFECDTCAQALEEFLSQRGVKGKRVKLYTGKTEGKYSNIYHDELQRNIATNGRHEGIAVEIGGEEIIFDNIHHEGISRASWMANLYCLAIDLGSGFEVTEVEF